MSEKQHFGRLFPRVCLGLQPYCQQFRSTLELLRRPGRSLSMVSFRGMWKSTILALTVSNAVHLQHVFGFIPNSLTVQPDTRHIKASNDDQFERLVPKTSFGSESVPEDQRPVNEYLDVLRQPMFDWASNEVGTKGLALRLAIVYAVSYGVVCFPISGASKFAEKDCNLVGVIGARDAF